MREHAAIGGGDAGHRPRGIEPHEALQALRRGLRVVDREVGRALQQARGGRDLVVDGDAQRLHLPDELPLAILLLQLPHAHRRDGGEQRDGHEDREDEDDEVRADSHAKPGGRRDDSAIRPGGEPRAGRGGPSASDAPIRARLRRHGPVPTLRAAGADRPRRYIARANVGASTSRARPAAAGSFTVMRHSVRACAGSSSVARCSSDALSQITRSPGS